MLKSTEKKVAKQNGIILTKSVIRNWIALEIPVVIFLCFILKDSDVALEAIVQFIMMTIAVIVFECGIIVAIQREICKGDDLNKYNRRQFNYENRVKSWRQESPMKLYFFTVILIGAIAFCPVIYNNRQSISNQIPNFFEMSDGTVASIIVGVYSIIIALVTVTDAYLKQKNILFEVDEILQVKKSVIVMCISAIVLIMDFIFFLNGKTEALNIGIIAWIIFVGWCIVLQFAVIANTYNGNYERRISKDMHKIYWSKQIFCTPNKIWHKGKMIERAVYLFKQLLKSSRGVVIENIKDITFGNVYDNNLKNMELAKSNRNKLLCEIIVIALVCIGAVYSFADENRYITIFLGILIGNILIPICIMYLFMINNEDMFRFLNIVSANSWGYYVEEKRPLKNLYIYLHMIIQEANMGNIC